MLRLELEALAEQNFDLELTGFDEKELAEVLAQETPRGTFDPEAVPELQSEAFLIVFRPSINLSVLATPLTAVFRR